MHALFSQLFKLKLLFRKIKKFSKVKGCKRPAPTTNWYRHHYIHRWCPYHAEYHDLGDQKAAILCNNYKAEKRCELMEGVLDFFFPHPEVDLQLSFQRIQAFLENSLQGYPIYNRT